MPLADKRGFVTRLMEQQWESRQPMTSGGTVNVVSDSVRVRVLSGEKAGARRRAQWRGHESIAKRRAFFGDAVDVRRFNVRMSGNAELVPTQVVDQNEDDVRPRRLALNRVRQTERGQDHEHHGSYGNSWHQIDSNQINVQLSRQSVASLELHQPNVPANLCIFIDNGIAQWRPRRIPDKCVQLSVLGYLLH